MPPGSVVTYNISLDAELANRIRTAADAFDKLCNLGFGTDTLTITPMSRIHQTSVLSHLLYGWEICAVTLTQVHRLIVLPMSCLRRVLGVSHIDKRTNASILSSSTLR